MLYPAESIGGPSDPGSIIGIPAPADTYAEDAPVAAAAARGDREEDAEGRQPPLAFDFCAGASAPVSYALAWCGWRVEVYDISVDSPHDISSGELPQSLWDRRSEVHACIWTPPCSTSSRTSDGLRPDLPHPSQPLRSQEFPLGVPGLAGQELMGH